MKTQDLTVEQKGQACALYKERGDLCPIHAGTISREEARAEMDVKARLDSADHKLQEWELSSKHDCTNNKVTSKLDI